MLMQSAFLLGLLGSFHCIGMCGPIAFALPIDRSNRAKGAFGVFLYHAGRIASYGLIGLLFGLIGRGLYLAGFQQRLSILIGVIMIASILFGKWLPLTARLNKPIFGLVQKVKNAMALHLRKKGPATLGVLGLLNGFLPCGLVYMAVFGAVAMGDLGQGAGYMALFGLGTVPMMTIAVYAGNFLKNTWRKKIQKAIPIFVVIIGLLFIVRGMGLGIPYVSPSDTQLIIGNDPQSCATE